MPTTPDLTVLAQIPLLAVAALATAAMLVALALATAGLTNCPEQARVTTLPVSLSVITVASWVAITSTEDLALLKVLRPAGAATELVANAWNGGVPIADSLLLLPITMAWVLVAVAVTVRLLRREPQR